MRASGSGEKAAAAAVGSSRRSRRSSASPSAAAPREPDSERNGMGASESSCPLRGRRRGCCAGSGDCEYVATTAASRRRAWGLRLLCAQEYGERGSKHRWAIRVSERTQQRSPRIEQGELHCCVLMCDTIRDSVCEGLSSARARARAAAPKHRGLALRVRREVAVGAALQLAERRLMVELLVARPPALRHRGVACGQAAPRCQRGVAPARRLRRLLQQPQAHGECLLHARQLAGLREESKQRPAHAWTISNARAHLRGSAA